MAIKSVGMVGVGTMGGAIAGHLLKAGYGVSVYDVQREPVERLGQKGAQPARSPKEVAASSELTIVVVVDDPQVREVCLGPEGILDGAKPDTIVAICSTVQPSTCREIGAKARARGVHVLDTPMIRGVAAALEGKLLLMVGGDAAALERCRPVFQTFAPDLCHLGDLGSGQVGKIVNNLVLWTCVVATREALTLARSQGLDPRRLRDALLQSSADNFVLREWDRVAGQPKWWDQKDLKGVLEMAEEHHTPVPVSAMVKELMKSFGLEEARKILGD